MAESESARFSRLCPACGRRVVRRVTTCRCGAALPPEAEDGPALEPADEASTPGLRSPVMSGAAVVLALVFGVYWFMQTAPAGDGPAQPGDGNIAERASAPTAAATSEPAPPSPAQREWEAGVSLGSATSATPAPAAPTVAPLPPPAAEPLSIEDIISRAMPAVVLVETPTGRGSGFYVKPDTILTNVHVVENNSVVTLRRGDGTSVSARVESRAPAYDIAVLRVLSAAPGQVTIPLGNAAGLRQGQDLIVIGSPLGLLQNTVTRGIVSALRRNGNATLVQTDAAINPGNSGGPVLDRTGAAIGITTMSFRESQGLNFAVSIDHARAILEGQAPPSSTTMSNAASGIRNFSPAAGSEADTVRAEGQRQLEGSLDELARVASTFDNEWQQFKDQCYSGSIVGSFDRNWFAILANGAMRGSVSPQCGTYFDGFKRNARKFEDGIKAACDAARRAGVYPGTVRDALRSRRLEFDGWSP